MPDKFDKVMLYAVNLVIFSIVVLKKATRFVLKYLKNYSSKFREKQSKTAALECCQEETKDKTTTTTNHKKIPALSAQQHKPLGFYCAKDLPFLFVISYLFAGVTSCCDFFSL